MKALFKALTRGPNRRSSPGRRCIFAYYAGKLLMPESDNHPTTTFRRTAFAACAWPAFLMTTDFSLIESADLTCCRQRAWVRSPVELIEIMCSDANHGKAVKRCASFRPRWGPQEAPTGVQRRISSGSRRPRLVSADGSDLGAVAFRKGDQRFKNSR